MTETNNKVLELVKGDIAFGVTTPVNPVEFYQNRDGLYVYTTFREEIAAKAKTVEEGKAYSLSSFNLAVRAADEAIEASLPESHLFDESDVCAIVAELIKDQPKGEDGILLTNGYANLFYIPSLVVLVGWGGGEWGVGAWGRGDDGWDAEGRVFSPATVA